ncbi:Crp/Fnr family transcriptional regulator [Ferruginibacter sp.]
MLDRAFPHFSKELLSDIEELSVPKFYDAGQTVVKKGQLLPGVHIITEGCIKIYQQSEQGNNFLIGYIKTGNSFAVSISDDSKEEQKRFVLNFISLEPTHILLMSFANKDMLAKKHDQWYKYILQTAVMYYSFYLEQIDAIAFRKMDSKVELFLKKLSKVKQSDVLKISHQEIADGLNTSREVISRLLKKMEEAGKIKMNHNAIKIISVL